MFKLKLFSSIKRFQRKDRRTVSLDGIEQLFFFIEASERENRFAASMYTYISTYIKRIQAYPQNESKKLG